jgi:hypothetical protein
MVYAVIEDLVQQPWEASVAWPKHILLLDTVSNKRQYAMMEDLVEQPA